MKKLLSVYVIAYLALLVLVTGLLCIYPKMELHLMLNDCHSPLLDTFFKYYTFLAEGPLYVVALLPLLWKKGRLTLFFALSELTSGALLQILKHSITTERPIIAFENCRDMVLPVVEGVDLHYGNSFPSGHASTFFVFSTCCALLLAYIYRQKAGQRSIPRERALFSLALLGLLFMAALGAYSRVYLSQHFLLDVCVGSIFGFVTPLLLYRYGRRSILKLDDE